MRNRKESNIWLKPWHINNHLNVSRLMAPHSSTLAWKIPWTEEPGRLQSMRSLRVGHDWATSLWLFTFMHWRRKMATRSSILAWRIPGMGEPGGLPSMGSHRVGHDWSNLAAAAAWLSGKESACQYRRHGLHPWVRKIPWGRKWPPIPVCFPGKSHEYRSLADYSPWGNIRVRHDWANKQQSQT